MDILESDPNLGALLREGTLMDFVKAHLTGQISFNSMVVCDVHRAGQRMRMVDYAIAQGHAYHAEYMIEHGAPLTLDLNDELARDNSGTLEGNWYTTLGYALQYSRCGILHALFTHRGDEIDVTRVAVFMGRAAGQRYTCSTYSGIQYALLHGERDSLKIMLSEKLIPSRLLDPTVVALFSKARMIWDSRYEKCEKLAKRYYRQAKQREDGARAALWCCRKGVGGPWLDVWFHLVPHIALTEVEHEKEKQQGGGGRRGKRQLE